jgi:hypothetical protein
MPASSVWRPQTQKLDCGSIPVCDISGVRNRADRERSGGDIPRDNEGPDSAMRYADRIAAVRFFRRRRRPAANLKE